eukprot:jgi/Botrbrau1/3997/Bobra.0016s0009.1
MPRDGTKKRARQQSALQPRSTSSTELPEELLRRILETGALSLPELAKLAPTCKLFRVVYRERCKAEEVWLTEAATSFFSDATIEGVLGDLTMNQDDLSGFAAIPGRRWTAHAPAPAELQLERRRTWQFCNYRFEVDFRQWARQLTSIVDPPVLEEGFVSHPNGSWTLIWKRGALQSAWLGFRASREEVACFSRLARYVRRFLLLGLARQSAPIKEFPMGVEGALVLDPNGLWIMDWRQRGPLICTIAPSTPAEEVACLGLVHLACKRVAEVLREFFLFELPGMPGTHPPSRRRSAKRAGCRISWNEVDEAPEDARRALSVLHMWNRRVGSSVPDFDLLWEVRSSEE